jgi:ATP-dependent exoDNAse (exonuclease V) beta subunit
MPARSPRRGTRQADDDPAPPSRPNLLIRASAGTGKTYQLSGQYIDRLRITEPDRILAVTFTRAAAGEILERVLLRLAEAALEPEKLRELSQQLGPLHGAPLTSEECLERLAALTRQLHRVRIGTLDSFFIQLAQCYSLELGLSPGWTILESIEEDQLLTAAIERLLHNDQHNGGPGGDVARLLNLLSKGDSARNVASLLRSTVRSFSTAYQDTGPEAWRQVPEPPPLSAEELREAVEALERIELPEPLGKLRSRESEYARDGLWEEFLNQGIAAKVAAGETIYKRTPLPAKAVRIYQKLVSHASAVLIRQLASRTAVTWDLLDRLHAELTALKQQHRGWTFEDVTRTIARGWQHSAFEHLDFRLDASIEHLLLDEFQDTSVPQWQALEPLAQRVAENRGMSLFCVGDQKQAIYGWRGGVAELFDALHERLPQLQEQTLDRSYRSSPAVIEAVNRMSQGLHHHPEQGELATAIRRFQERFVEHQTANRDLPGWVTLETPPASLEGDVFAFAVQRIQETHARLPSASLGVLAVKNETVAHLARELRRKGIDVSEEGGRALNDSVAVQLILSLLRLADHPGDTAARFHVATSPLGEAIGLGEEASPEEVHHLATRIRRDLMEHGYGCCVANWARALAPSCDSRGVGRLTQLVNIAYDYTPHATLRTSDFIVYVEAQEVLQPSASRVRLMTIHRAKGLEFDIVFLPELDNPLLPQTPQYVSRRPKPVEPPDAVIRYANQQLVNLLPEDLQQVFQADKVRRSEERLCVLYVAVTRARHALHLLVKPSSPPSKSRKRSQADSKLPQTMAGLLRAALTDGGPLPPGTVLTISGDPEWHSRVPELARGAEAPSPPQPPLRIRLAPPRHDSISRLEEVQPSRHRQGRIRMTDIFSPPSAARSRGSLLHAWFEQIAWLDDGPPDDELLLWIAYRWELPEIDIPQAIEDFRAMLAMPSIASILSRRAYQGPQGLFGAALAEVPSPPQATLRVRTEHRFAAPVDNLLIRGSMDRLVLLEHHGKTLAADICDYKTDLLEGLDPAVVEERLAGYREQLRLYARAAAHQFELPDDRVSARLILLGPGRVEPVTFP